MHGLLRHPLTWLVAGEAAVVGALLGTAWYIFSLPSGPPPVVIASARPLLAAPSPSARPAPKPASARVSSSPGPAVTSGLAFPVDLGRLNRDGAAFEAAEASVMRALESALLSYIERVVVPSVLGAESESAARNAAAAQSPAATRNTP